MAVAVADSSSKEMPQALRDELSGHMTWAESTAAALRLPPERGHQLARCAGAVRARLADRNLYIAIVGEFNSGKSTFINTLIGDQLLPTAPIVTTAAATELRHGERLRVSFRPVQGEGEGDEVVVDHDDDRPSDAAAAFAAQWRVLFPATPVPSAPREALPLLIADSAVSGGVARVRIQHPAPLLARDTVLVDTPGINATDDGHGAVVARVVDEVADLAVVLVPASSPVSEVLAEFVKGALRRHLDRCVFVVTKIEQVPSDERGVLVAHVRRRVERAGALKATVLVAPPGPANGTVTVLEPQLTALAAREHLRATTASAVHLVEELLRAATDCAAERREEIRRVERDLDRLRLRDLDAVVADATRRVDEALARAAANGPDVAARAASARAAVRAELTRELAGCSSLAELKTYVEDTAPARVGQAAQELIRSVHDEVAATSTSRCHDALRVVARAVEEEYAHLTTLAGHSAGAMEMPRLELPRPTVVAVESAAGAAAGVGRAIKTEEWKATGVGVAGATVGAILGSLVAPGIGTAIGGIIGSALEPPGAERTLAVTRQRVGDLLHRDADRAFDDAERSARESVERIPEAQRAAGRRFLVDLEATWRPRVRAMLEEERRRRRALAEARSAAERAGETAAERLRVLRTRRQELAATRGVTT